jgi:hypothetical protein
MSEISFQDLPLITDGDELRRVHNTDGLYYAKRGETAHSSLDCTYLEPDHLIRLPNF